GPATRVNENLFGSESSYGAVVELHFDSIRTSEASIARKQVDVLCFLNSLQYAFAKLFDDPLLARADLFHVHGDIAAVHAKIHGASRQISNSRAIEHSLRRRAAVVDARAANVSAFNQRGLPASFPKRSGQRFTRL